MRRIIASMPLDTRSRCRAERLDPRTKLLGRTASIGDLRESKGWV
jgi:hypothetical protein